MYKQNKHGWTVLTHPWCSDGLDDLLFAVGHDVVVDDNVGVEVHDLLLEGADVEDGRVAAVLARQLVAQLVRLKRHTQSMHR